MRITTRARDPENNEVAIWMKRPIRTYAFHDSGLSTEDRHKEAATRWHIEQTGRVPEQLTSNQVGIEPQPYKRTTWVHNCSLRGDG